MTTREKFGLPGSEDREYWMAIREWAKELESDGCSWSKDFFKETCLEHDCHWRSGHTLFGDPISTQAANNCFREAIQQRSRFKKLSPVAAFRWSAVSLRGLFK